MWYKSTAYEIIADDRCVCKTYMAKWIRCAERKYEVPAHHVFP